MEFLAYTIEIALIFVATITWYYLQRYKPSITKTHATRTSEPPGALPIIGHLHLLRGQAPVARTLGSMADKYGPIFSLRLGSRRGLVVSNWESTKECFTTNDRVFATRPCMAVSKYLGYNYAAFALAPYGPYWRDVRKLVTLELFTTYGLEKLGHVRASEVDHFIKELYSLSTKSCTDDANPTVAINTWFEHLTFNITIRKLVGRRCSSSCKTGANKDWQFREAISKALYLSGVFPLSDAVPALEWLDIGGYIKAMKQTAKELDKQLEDWVRERIQIRGSGSYKTDESCDFLDVMLSSIQENEFVSGYDRETIIKATMLILAMTGSESTAETLTWALSLLLNNHHALKIAQEELQTNVGPHKWVQESDIKNLEYLEAIVKETLRLYPPGPLAGPHEAIQDCYVGDHFVPKGTRLIVNLWKLHRDPNVWSEPNEFRPQRFLHENKHTNFRGQCFEYIPFSSGRRMCPGMNFGLQVVQLTLARLLHAFDVSTPMGKPVDMEEGLGIALPKVKPLEVVLTPRLPLELYQNL